MTHVGYRCPNADCTGKSTVYRSALADAQALPGFSFGLDIVALVGHLKLHHHQTVDEVHQNVNERLKDYQISMSRRNVLYLFEAYGSLLKAAAQNKSDPAGHRLAWASPLQWRFSHLNRWNPARQRK